MDHIQINKTTKINLNFEPQTGSLGRPFRLSGTSKNLQKPSKWIRGVEKWCWIHSFRYLDEKGGYFNIEVDYENKYVKF